MSHCTDKTRAYLSVYSSTELLTPPPVPTSQSLPAPPPRRWYRFANWRTLISFVFIVFLAATLYFPHTKKK